MRRVIIRKTEKISDNKWYRYSAYGVAGGYIRPVMGATITEYDPWQPFRDCEGVSRTVDPPYRSFLEVGRRLTQYDLLIFEKQIPEVDRLIGEWCTQWGLLGV